MVGYGQRIVVSIPKGSIKRTARPHQVEHLAVFQFQKVRLKGRVGDGQGEGDAPFQFQKVRLKEISKNVNKGWHSCFNSKRFD